MKMKKIYNSPKIEITELEITDIIRTSGETPDNLQLNTSADSINSVKKDYSAIVSGDVSKNLFE